ncbi:MAG: pseudouridine synthase [Porphyromonas sp.]|nr:pseudouridine synthase [Porphyromonas sp.]
MKKNISKLKMPRVARPEHSYSVAEGQAEGGLLAFLTQYALKDRSRTTVKQLLGDRYISVNGEATTQWDYALSVGDRVVLHPAPLPTTLHHRLVDILWQDEDLILIHKAAGIPTVASGEERDETAMQVVSKHLKKFNPRAKVFLLNRIDKDCSGFVLMAKTPALQAEMSEHWGRYVLRQQFVLVAEGQMPDSEGYLAAPSNEDPKGRKPSRHVRGSETAGQARYRCLQQTELGALVVVELLEGRNNRLRRQMSALKRPIMGDWRNGSKRKDLGMVALESMAFSFVHPKSKRRYDFDQPIPGKFRRLLKP